MGAGAVHASFRPLSWPRVPPLLRLWRSNTCSQVPTSQRAPKRKNWKWRSCFLPPRLARSQHMIKFNDCSSGFPKCPNDIPYDMHTLPLYPPIPNASQAYQTSNPTLHICKHVGTGINKKYFDSYAARMKTVKNVTHQNKYCIHCK